MVTDALALWATLSTNASSAKHSRRKGFVADLERILLAVDEGANGRFTARLAGVIAGPRGIPITVLQLGREAPRPVEGGEDVSEVAKAAAQPRRPTGLMSVPLSAICDPTIST